MSQAYKICPICGTPAHPNAALCSTCGTTLDRVETSSGPKSQPLATPTYDPRYGETDLLESTARGKHEVYLLGGMLALALLVCVGGLALLGVRAFNAFSPAATPTLIPTANLATGPDIGAPLVTNTPRPTLNLPTVTPAPPTATPSPTQGPCTVTVQQGDNLLGLAYSCGHRSMDIIPTILELNDMDAPESMQVGQVLEIPWPTATPDPNTLPTEEVDAAEDEAQAPDDSQGTLAPFEEAIQESAAIATETLQPGVAWHRVNENENIISIAFAYGANVEILSQLNPQVTFSQCDYSLDTGGPNCIVQIYVGQLIRVPAPTPTPTIQPTASGSETATPTATATRNIPSLTSPGSRSLFRRDEFITLRWVATGGLMDGQAYQVRVTNLTDSTAHIAETKELFFIIPQDWQGTDERRHDYEWSISVIEQANPENPLYTTETRLFTWEGRGDNP